MRGAGREVCLWALFRGMFRGSVSHLSPQIERQKCAVCFVVCFEGLFRGSVSPKSNFPALLEVGHPKKIQTHIKILVFIALVRSWSMSTCQSKRTPTYPHQKIASCLQGVRKTKQIWEKISWFLVGGSTWKT